MLCSSCNPQYSSIQFDICMHVLVEILKRFAEQLASYFLCKLRTYCIMGKMHMCNLSSYLTTTVFYSAHTSFAYLTFSSWYLKYKHINCTTTPSHHGVLNTVQDLVIILHYWILARMLIISNKCVASTCSEKLYLFQDNSTHV